MTKTKKKMFKTTSTVHLENLSDDGDWNSFMDILKQQDQFTSAYVEKVRISFVQDNQLSTATGEIVPWSPCLFAAATNSTLSDTTPGDNSKYIIASGASRGGGGTVTLNLNRRIVLNEIDPESGEAAIRLFIKNPDVTAIVGDLKVYLVIETFGRWHKTQAL